jgi:RNA polymerase sigma factor (sigma-70 family)
MEIDKFETLFREHYRGMYRLAFAMLHDTEQSKDIVSDVFARMCDGRILLRPKVSSSAFLLTCVRNQCLNHIASMKRDEKLRNLYALEDAPTIAIYGDDTERWRQINEFVDTELTSQTRAMIKLCFLERLTYKEASEELGISVAAVNKHIVQGLQELRKQFKR